MSCGWTAELRRLRRSKAADCFLSTFSDVRSRARGRGDGRSLVALVIAVANIASSSLPSSKTRSSDTDRSSSKLFMFTSLSSTASNLFPATRVVGPERGVGGTSWNRLSSRTASTLRPGDTAENHPRGLALAGLGYITTSLTLGRCPHGVPLHHYQGIALKTTLPFCLAGGAQASRLSSSSSGYAAAKFEAMSCSARTGS